jgi:diguanylate cyclase (GGDEF)-like protein
MKITQAAVLGASGASRKKLVEGLKKAGLKVSAAEGPDALSREQLVVIAPGASAAKLAKAARAALSEAVVVAAQQTLGPAKWADAVVPLPLSSKDLKARLPDFARLREPPAPPQPRPGEGILDPLTGFYTFNHFKDVLFVEVKRARRYGFPLAVALIAFDPLDIRPTEEIRTQLLGGLALAIRRSLRDTDYPVQYGVDRVLLLMPHTPLQGAVVVSKRICERVARASLTHDGQTVHPTISIGVSSGGSGSQLAFADLARQAQQSLDSARNSGGNRVEFFDIAEEAVTNEQAAREVSARREQSLASGRPIAAGQTPKS